MSYVICEQHISQYQDLCAFNIDQRKFLFSLIGCAPIFLGMLKANMP